MVPEPDASSFLTGRPEPRATLVRTLSLRELFLWIGWCTLLFLPTAALGVGLKSAIVVEREVERLAVMMFRANGTITFVEKLTFVRNDLLVGLIAVPVVLGLCTWFLPKRVRVGIVVFIAVLAAAIEAAQTLSFVSVGKFLTWDLGKDAIQWGLAHPADLLSYMGDINAAKLAVGAGAFLAVILLARIIGRKIARRWRMPRFSGDRLVAGSAPALFVLYGFTALTWAVPMPRTTYHTSMLSLTTGALFVSDEKEFRKAAEAGPAAIQRDYQELTAAPPHRHSSFFGAARGYDVLMFIMETGPAACLDTAGDLSEMPTLRALRETAWIGTRHYTTYPITNKAVFSIYTSMYPTGGARFFQNSGRAIPSIFRSVRTVNYRSGMYMPSSITSGGEKAVNRMMGVERTVISNSKQMPAEPQQSLWHAKADDDLAALRSMERDMNEWSGAGQHYVTAFLPQIAHAPWVDVVSGGSERNIVRRGRNLMALQDTFLGEVVEMLRHSGRLDRTLILVTADHGIRTSVEDPSFTGGRLSDYSFHVPLLLYAPGVLRERKDIGVLTSHIDIMPSLLDLLGISDGRDAEEGSPLWAPEIAGRRTFFWAKDYLGADGYYSEGKFHMLVYDLGSLYEAPWMDFTQTDLLRGESAEKVRSTTRRMAATQFACYNMAIR